MVLLKDSRSFSSIQEPETAREIYVFTSQKPDSLWFLDTSQTMLIKTNALLHRGAVCRGGAVPEHWTRVLFELGGCLYSKAPHRDVYG